MQTPKLFDLIDQALGILRSRHSDLFTVEEIGQIIQNELGHRLDTDALPEIKRIMHSRWGSGIEPAALGGQLWRFGHSKPPVSREIRGR